MGTYSYGEYLDTFGGPPEPGETYPDDPDALRDRLREEDMERHAHSAELRDRFANDHEED